MQALFRFMIRKQFKTAGFWVGVLLPGIVMTLFFNFLPGFWKTIYAASAMSTGITIAVILGWGHTFSLVKNSSLLKGIRTSNIRKREYFLVGFLSSLLMFLAVFAILWIWFVIISFAGILEFKYFESWGPLVKEVDVRAGWYFTHLNYGKLFAGFISTWVLASALGFFITSISKSQVQYETITWTYMLLFIFFGGTVIPQNMLRLPMEISQDDRWVEVMLITFSNMVPTSWTNFYVADVMAKPLYDLSVGFDSPYHGLAETTTWWVPLIWDAGLGTLGLGMVFYWD